MAIKREEQAIKDYSVLAQLSKRDEEKALFERLALMERGHKAHLERIYQNCLRKMFLIYDSRKRPRIALECRNCK